MIDKVIIYGMRRANQLVEQQEIQQAVGRAGRSYEKPGEAIILCHPEDEEYASSCLEDSTPPIQSRLNTISDAAFQVLPWIDTVYDDDTFDAWYGRSLGNLQGIHLKWNDIRDYLLLNSCIDEDGNMTEFGRISVRMYIHPDKLKLMESKLDEIVESEDEIDDVSLSYAMSSEHVFISDVGAFELNDYKSSVVSRGYMFQNGELIHGFAYYCLFSGECPKWIRNVTRPLKEDLERMMTIAKMICDCRQWKNCADSIELEKIKAMKKVGLDVAGIMKEFGISNKRVAMELESLGVFTRNDLEDFEDRIVEFGSDELKRELQKNGYLPDLLAKEWRNNQSFFE